MQITFDLPEPLLVAITNEANKRDRSPESVLITHLVAGMEVQVGGRSVILQGTQLTALEERLGHGQINSANDLVKKVEGLARIQFGAHEIRLTPAELEEIAWRAKKADKTVEQLIEATWRRMNELFFSYAQRA